MELRLRAFAEIDERAVPLPHGTEVVTRVERVHGERRVPQGSVGRVVKGSGEAYDVTIVGVGTLSFQRAELVPRRVGQMLFARRREIAWSALEQCTVLETVVGSHAWGLCDEQSDVDRRGVFVVPLPWTQGLVAAPDTLVSADGSATLWSADKALRQALRADPNTLEMLFVPGAQPKDPMGEWLLAERDAFASAEIHGSFGRYALAQLRRLEQGARLAEHRHLLLTWLREDPVPDLDAVAERLADVTPRASPSRADAVQRAKQWVKQLYRSLADQGLLAASDFTSLVAFAHQGAADLDLPRELRPKNAYNLLRLVWTATDWLRSGTPSFEATGQRRDRLFAVKHGEVPLAEVLAEAEASIPALDRARDETKLPARADLGRADALLCRIGEEVARRSVHKQSGAWGADAPAPPAAEWVE